MNGWSVKSLSHNRRVLNLASRFGFEIVAFPDAGTMFLRLDLASMKPVPANGI